MSRNRPLSFELGWTVAHITVKPLNEESYSSCFHLPASEVGGLPSQQRRSLGLALTLHLSLPLFPGLSNPSTALLLEQTVTGTSLTTTKKRRGGPAWRAGKRLKRPRLMPELWACVV